MEEGWDPNKLVKPHHMSSHYTENKGERFGELFHRSSNETLFVKDTHATLVSDTLQMSNKKVRQEVHNNKCLFEC